MATTEEALVLAALADDDSSGVTLPAGWLISSFTGTGTYGAHGLSYNVYVNTSTKQIAIAFGDDINVDTKAGTTAIDATLLQTPGGASTLALMNDAASLALNIFVTTLPGYTGSPIDYDNGVPIGQGYTVFITGAGIGGVAAQYAMEAVLSSFPVAQSNNLLISP
jgi:hypothetical protein